MANNRVKSAGEAFERLVAVMDRLRDPGGCPWDREQTFASLRPFMVEETAEALEALDNEDWPHFAEELGDILLQVVFHAKMGKEAGHFDVIDVVEGISNKMVSRHPHVFGDSNAKTAGEVQAQWEELKAAEKPHAAQPGLKPLPPALPALAQAQKTVSRAAKRGFQWPTQADAWNKVREETTELQTAAPENRDEEFGDLLFALVNVARIYDLDAEGALGRATAKFRKRFQVMDELLQREGKQLETLRTEEKLEAWAKAKGKLSP